MPLRELVRSLHSHAKSISLLINKRRLLARLQRLFCVSKMSFGTNVTSFRQLAPSLARTSAPSLLPSVALRVSGFCLVNNLNEGGGQSRRAALPHENPRDPVGRAPSHRNPDRSRRAGLFDKINPVFRPGTIVSGGSRWCATFLYRHSFLNLKMLSVRSRYDTLLANGKPFHRVPDKSHNRRRE